MYTLALCFSLCDVDVSEIALLMYLLPVGVIRRHVQKELVEADAGSGVPCTARQGHRAPHRTARRLRLCDTPAIASAALACLCFCVSSHCAICSSRNFDAALAAPRIALVEGIPKSVTSCMDLVTPQQIPRCRHPRQRRHRCPPCRRRCTRTNAAACRTVWAGPTTWCWPTTSHRPRRGGTTRRVATCSRRFCGMTATRTSTASWATRSTASACTPASPSSTAPPTLTSSSGSPPWCAWNERCVEGHPRHAP